MKGPRPKHIPNRTCVACGQIRPKRELTRVVRGLDGQVEPDPTGKKAGRGAYLCPVRGCWEQAFRKGALEHALAIKIAAETRQALQQYAVRLPEVRPHPGNSVVAE